MDSSVRSEHPPCLFSPWLPTRGAHIPWLMAPCGFPNLLCGCSPYALNLSHLPSCLISAREGSLLFTGSKVGMWTLLLVSTLEGQAEELSKSDLSTCLRKMVESTTQEVSLALSPITLIELSKIVHYIESTKDKMLDPDSKLEGRIFLGSKITAGRDCSLEI